MYKLCDFMGVLEVVAPLWLSQKMIDNGDYDNSGIIVKSSDSVNKVLFTLDLSLLAVEKAKELGCDTIVTHHPAIYMPVKELGVSNGTKPLVDAIQNRINVISMHLNLDVASAGIDQYLAIGLGGKVEKLVETIDDIHGYGRVSVVKEQTLKEFSEFIKNKFNTDKVLCYGQRSVNKIASFCGSGGSKAVQGLGEDVDTVITSDLAHHQLKELVEQGKNVVIIPHYVSEQFGFNEFYKKISKTVAKEIETFYFVDNRFM